MVTNLWQMLKIKLYSFHIENIFNLHSFSLFKKKIFPFFDLCVCMCVHVRVYICVISVCAHVYGSHSPGCGFPGTTSTLKFLVLLF